MKLHDRFVAKHGRHFGFRISATFLQYMVYVEPEKMTKTMRFLSTSVGPIDLIEKVCVCVWICISTYQYIYVIYPLVMTNTSPWSHGLNRNRWFTGRFTELKNGWIFPWSSIHGHPWVEDHPPWGTTGPQTGSCWVTPTADSLLYKCKLKKWNI